MCVHVYATLLQPMLVALYDGCASYSIIIAGDGIKVTIVEKGYSDGDL